ncbi:MAG TPA: HipA family kinase [Thermoleophilaceae bacterium]|nr:HipA family kinase [Thermoleophilaceae bacterium]
MAAVAPSGAMLENVAVTRYVTPLREGGSLPALVEADDEGLYVVKFRGAGQGPKALVADVLAGELGRRLGLAVPRLVLADLDPALAPAEPDEEIQDLLRASRGANLGVDFLPGALAYDAAAEVAPATAAGIVWFDSLVTNVDRTPRNPNLLLWHGRLWLIDHGAAFYAHHSTADFADRAREPFPLVSDHVLLPRADSLHDVDERLSAALTRDVIEEAAALVPDEWLEAGGVERRSYVDFLARRLEPPREFAQEAEDARRGA